MPSTQRIPLPGGPYRHPTDDQTVQALADALEALATEMRQFCANLADRPTPTPLMSTSTNSEPAAFPKKEEK